ncbi:MAG TPA: right-handed parallel beta-helix repeat-containing protein, partial [Candidatus Nanoarchaeia archaeon]|nr:right-handed parallel beta-helix repeat-containing protein [Candidatus Nanoarchaeia archaeon]
YIKNENGTFINNTFSSPNSAGVAIIFGNSTNSRFIGNIFINKTSAFRGSPTNSYFSDSSAANVIGFISLLSISGAAGEVFYPLNNTFYNMTFTSVIRSITIENASFNNFSNIRFLTPISAISISLNSDSNIFENINITNSSDFSIVINDRSDNNIFDRIRISRPSNTGATQDNVFINVSENTTVRNSNFVSNRGNAIYAFNANGTKILNNVISNQSKNGIILNISNSIEIFHNTIRNNTEYGISLISSHFNNLINNTISLNNKSGIILTSSNSNDITNNTLMRNTESGIYLTSSNSNDITNNTITQNTESGIYLTVSNLNNFSYNTIDNNTLHGISLLSSNSSNIIGNLIRNNSRNGIVLNNSILNELLDNNFSGQGTATVTYYVSNSPRNYSGVPYWDYVSTPTSLYEINISGTFYEYWVTSSEQAISEIDGTFNLSMCLCYLPDVFGWNITMYVNKDLVNTTGCDNLLLNPPLSLPSSNCNYYEKDVFVAQGAGYDYDTNFNSSSQEITSGTAQSPFIDARQPGPYSSIEIINSDNTSISNNNLLNTKGRAVTIFGSDNILLDDSDIIGSGLISSLLGAIQIDPSSNITIRDSNISNNIGTGINISNNSLVYIINNTINNNTGYGINIEDNSTSTINENTICENTLGAINSVDSLIIPSFPEIVTVNNSICLTNENKLSINWFVQARTINASGNVTNATVNIYDLGNSTAKFTGLTGAFGLSDVVLVNQFIVNNSDLQINATPHNFTANKSAQTNESIIFIDSSRTYSRGNEIVLTLFACAGDYGAFSDWSDCVSGSQTRTRTDSTGCTQTETQSCSVTTTGGGGSCVPNCAGIECGPDLVCGESCGSCASGETCVDGICTEEEIICTEDWQCGWTVCAEDDISSYPYDCADLNNCGTFENMPDDAISCQERSQIEDETSGLGWSCSAWSECDAKYTIEDVLKEKISSSGQQSRSCKGSNNIERVEYKKCSLAIPIRISKSSWCHEEIVELFRNDTNEFVSRIQASEIIGFENLNRVDIFFATGEFTGYCSYCFNGVQDYDETSVDCGGENCPECLMKYDFFDWVFLVKIILLVLSIILLSFFYRRVGTEVEFGKKFIRLAGSIADFFKSNKARDRRIEQKITGVFKR